MNVSLLSKNDIEKIHEASLSILERIGIHVPHEEVLSRFADIGAIVDNKERLVKIPPAIVKELISKAGKKFSLYGRNLSKKAEFGTGKINFNTSSGQAFWLDNIGEDRRYATLSDVIMAAKFGEILSQITIPGAMADPQEIPIQWRAIEVANIMIQYTEKPITFWFFDRLSTKFLMDFLITLRGDEEKARKYPLFQPLFEPVSPLSFPFNGIDLLFETAKLNIPVQIGPMAQMGVSAPCTIAGTLAQENAEILSGICITQLIKPGLPICYGGICHAFDMRSVQIIFGGPEQALFSVAMTEMGKFYGFPVYINAGLTDSKRVDAQAGLEIGITLSMGLLAKADIFGHLGICGMDQAASLDMLLLQSEIISYVKNLNRDLIINEKSLALDVIEKVGPRGSFLETMHTLKNYRKALWSPRLLNREDYPAWKEKGGFDVEKKCAEMKSLFLEQYEQPHLDPDIKKDLEHVITKARKESTNHVK